MPAARGAVDVGVRALHEALIWSGMPGVAGAVTRKTVELGRIASNVLTTPTPLTFSLKPAVLLRPSVMPAKVTTWLAVRLDEEGPRNGPEKEPLTESEFAAEPLHAT